MVLRVLFCLALAVGLAGPLHAQERPKGVVELFTSQGCSSCPPADDAFRKLVSRSDVVALAYHVDYWNYMGWTDTLSSKENTQRQYGYARMMGRGNVYTPQVIVNGREHVSGTDLSGIDRRLEEFPGEGKGLTVPITTAMRGDELEITVGSGQGKANVVLVYYNREKTIDVEKGENTGRKISYLHSVANVETIGMWNGKQATFRLPATLLQKPDLEGCAVLLQTSTADGDPAAILGATVIPAGKNI